MFKKVLIANRGEIACRVIKTLRKMNIKSVAVYSDPDKNSLHVKLADESIRIGEAESSLSYLNIDNIILACKNLNVDAVHPGYGFLSENVNFKRRLDKEKIKFIGPGQLAIDIMGDKIRSKKIAQDAGVPTVPGYTDIINNPKHAIEVSREIGYPVMLKASAGGGGKGMRVSYNDEETIESFERAKSEALSSFGDDRIFIEKFIENPRHIEIQVLADNYGNYIYLGERECSIQRRHQKVIEESPSPFIDSSQRKEMGDKAVLLAKKVDYVSAGTVEFIVDQNHNFYFLEMNTRLQVEHPVTEMVTGIDLVEWMVLIAYGEKLKIKQEQVKINGWAMESRIYAEDPYRSYLPSTGRLIKYSPPDEDKNTRVDTGVFEGGDISMYYDPMIAKLCTWGENRKDAINFMRDALNKYVIKGLKHNVPFLSSIMLKESFINGDLSTNFIEREYPNGLINIEPDPLSLERSMLVFVLVNQLSHYRFVLNQDKKYKLLNNKSVIKYNEKNYEIEIVIDSINGINIFDNTSYNASVKINKNKFDISIKWNFYSPRIFAEINQKQYFFQIDNSGLNYKIYHNGFEISPILVNPKNSYLYEYMPEKVLPDLSKYLISPMPGLLVSIDVKEGQEVKAGQTLAIIEAMKMENILRADQDITIKSISKEIGSSLAVDQVIMEFE